MSPLKRRLLRWTFILGGAGFLALTGLALYANVIIRRAIEHVGSEMTGTAVAVGKVRCQFLRGRLRLYKFRVRNPQGFRIQNAFMADLILIDIDWKSLLGDTLVVRQVLVRRPTVVYEAKLGGSNIKRIERAIDAYSGEGESTTAVVVKRFRVTDGRIVLGTRLLGRKKGLTLKMPEIDLKDLGSGSGSWKDTAKAMSGSLAGATLKAARRPGKTLGEMTGSAKKSAKKALSSLKSVFKR